MLSEDFFAGKALVSREGIAEMDIAKEIFALEDGDGRRTSKRELCNIRRHIPHYPVYPIKKAEPFKQWMASVADYRRLGFAEGDF